VSASKRPRESASVITHAELIRPVCRRREATKRHVSYLRKHTNEIAILRPRLWNWNGTNRSLRPKGTSTSVGIKARQIDRMPSHAASRRASLAIERGETVRGMTCALLGVGFLTACTLSCAHAVNDAKEAGRQTKHIEKMKSSRLRILVPAYWDKEVDAVQKVNDAKTK